ncbi:MAG: ATP synthase subunit C family protein [Alphaproteobacteria bacterium]
MEPITNPEATILVGKFIGAGLTVFGMLGAAIGVGMIFAAALNGIARNPSKESSIKGLAMLGMALAEFMGILAFAVAMMIFFVVK